MTGLWTSPFRRVPHTLFSAVCGLIFTLLTMIHASTAVAAQKPLKIAYRSDSAPLQYTNEKGLAEGILIDYWRAWSAQTHQPVQFIGGSNAETQEWLSKGEVDLIAGLFKNSKRENEMEFSVPILNSKYFLYKNQALQNTTSSLQLNQSPIGVTLNSFHHQWLKTNHPEAQIATYDNYRSLFQAAINGELSLFITQPLYLETFLKSHPTTEQFKALQPPLYSRPYQAAVRKGNDSLLATINKGIEQVGTSQQDAISTKWSGFHWEESSPEGINSQIQTEVKLTSEERAWLQQHSVIPIGVDGRWPPVDFIGRNGVHTGILQEYLSLFEKQLGIKFEPRVFGSFKDMVTAVQEGSLKVGATIVKTEQREENLWFTSPYFSAVKVIVTQKSSSPYPNLEALHDHTLAIEEGFYLIDLLQKDHPEIKLQTFSSTEEALKAVSFGTADAYIGNQAVVSWFMDSLQLTNLTFTGDPEFPPAHQRFAVHQNSEWKPLIKIINKALDAIPANLHQQIHKNWVNSAGNGEITGPLILSQAQYKWLESHPDWRLGIDSSWAPFEFVNEKGEYSGISAELFQLLSHKLDVSYTPVTNLSWQQVQKQLKDGELDLLPSAAPTPKRHQKMLFTKPYMVHPYMVLVHQETRFVTGLDDLKGKKVGIVKGHAIEETLTLEHPEFELVTFNNNQQALMALSGGDIDAYIGILGASSWTLEKSGIRNIKVTATTPYTFQQSIAVRKDWPELVEILNKAIDHLTTQQIQNIENKWFSVQFEHQHNHYQIWRAILITCAILFPIIIYTLLWNRKLSRARAHLKESREKLAIAKEEAERSSEFKSQFLANMSHEIRTPMNAIVGMTHLLQSTELTDKQKDYSNKIQRASLTLLGVINDILDFSKVEAGKLELESNEFPLHELFLSLTNLMGHKAAEKGVELLIDIDSSLPELLIGDSLRIEQILINLATNAIKFTEQGEVVLRARALEQDENEVTIEFSVKDSGIGIEPEKLEGLFQPFTQADGSNTRQYGGTGLGLSICKQLVELMGGTISAKSSLGHGSLFQFTLTLPLSHSQDQLQAIRENNALKGMKVLVVDDNTNAREIFKELLCSFSFEVDLASSGTEAIEKISQQNSRSDQAPYQLVLMDWQMPGLNGIEASRSIRYLPLMHTPVIILVTAYGREDLIQETESELLDAVLIKPLNASILFDTLMKLFAAPDEQTSPCHLEQSQQLSGRILLVEDQPINQQVAKELLEKMGLEISLADHGQQALDALEKESFDLILMDVQMPVMDGFEATRQIRTRYTSEALPVIAMTAHAMKGDREKCLEAGMDEHIAKPVEPEQLWQVLSQFLPVDETALQPQNLNDADQETDEIAGLDIKWGISRLGSNRELYFQLIAEFYTRHKDELTLIQQHRADNDEKAIKRIIHTLRGVSGNLGAKQLEIEAARFEQKLQTGNNPFATEEWQKFEFAFEALFQALAQHCQQQNIDNEPESKENRTLEGDSDAVQQQLSQLEQLLLSGNPKAKEKLIELQPSLDADTFKKITTQINEYEFDNARKIITNLIAKEV